jgi:hypothetical protein
MMNWRRLVKQPPNEAGLAARADWAAQEFYDAMFPLEQTLVNLFTRRPAPLVRTAPHSSGAPMEGSGVITYIAGEKKRTAPSLALALIASVSLRG